MTPDAGLSNRSRGAACCANLGSALKTQQWMRVNGCRATESATVHPSMVFPAVASRWVKESMGRPSRFFGRAVPASQRFGTGPQLAIAKQHLPHLRKLPAIRMPPPYWGAHWTAPCAPPLRCSSKTATWIDTPSNGQKPIRQPRCAVRHCGYQRQRDVFAPAHGAGPGPGPASVAIAIHAQRCADLPVFLASESCASMILCASTKSVYKGHFRKGGHY